MCLTRQHCINLHEINYGLMLGLQSREFTPTLRRNWGRREDDVQGKTGNVETDFLLKLGFFKFFIICLRYPKQFGIVYCTALLNLRFTKHSKKFYRRKIN